MDGLTTALLAKKKKSPLPATFTTPLYTTVASSGFAPVSVDFTNNYITCFTYNGSTTDLYSLSLSGTTIIANSSSNHGGAIWSIRHKHLSGDTVFACASSFAYIINISSGSHSTVTDTGFTSGSIVVEEILYNAAGNYIVAIGDNNVNVAGWKSAVGRFNTNAGLTTSAYASRTTTHTTDSFPTTGAEFDPSYYFEANRANANVNLFAYPTNITSTLALGGTTKHNLASANIASGKVLFIYNATYAIVTRTGSTISASTPVSITDMATSTNNSDHLCALAKMADNSLILAYKQNGTSNIRIALVSVSGSTVTISNTETMTTSATNIIDIAYNTVDGYAALIVGEGLIIFKRTWMV